MLRLVPPGVHDKMRKSLAPQASQLFRHARLRGHAPGGAILIEEQRQRFGRHSAVQDPHQAAGSVIHRAAAADREIGPGTLQPLPGAQRLAPVAIEIICQPAGQRHSVILPEHLHLPRGRMRQPAAPDNPVSSVLQRHPRVPLVHRHGPHLTEPLPPDSVPGPGGLQVQRLQPLGAEPRLHAPAASQPVEPQLPGSRSLLPRREPTQGKAGQQLQRDRRPAPLLRLRPNRQVRPFSIPGEVVRKPASRRMLQHRDRLHSVALPAAFLPRQAQSLDGTALVERHPVAIASRALLPGEIGLNQPLGLSALPPRLHRGLQPGRQQLQFQLAALLLQHIARRHIPRRYFTQHRKCHTVSSSEP